MKRRDRIVVVFLAIIMVSMLFSAAAYANSAEPPGFTVIVSNPPTDLSLSLQLDDGTQSAPILLSKESKGWEAYYRFFYHMSPRDRDSLDGAVLIVQSSEESFQSSLPADSFNTYNNLLTLDMDTQSITVGQPALRVPLLVSMRVGLTLIIEGFIFLLFGYRRRQSWITFFVINIITQGGLNALITGPGTGSYWMIGFIFGEFVVFAVEILSFSYFIKEFSIRRAVLYALTANLASLTAGGLLIAYLPI